MVWIQYLARDPANAQHKIRRGDYRDMERADRDLEELENTPEAEDEDSCPEPFPGEEDHDRSEKDESS